MGRTRVRRRGSRRANSRAPSTQAMPPTRTVPGAPMISANAAREQAAERGHAQEGHAVKAHHSAALVLLDDRLQDGVARRHLHHHAEARQHQEQDRKPQDVRQGETDQADAESGGGQHNGPPQPQDRLARGQVQGPCQGADARGAVQETEGVRASVQDVGGEDRQQHRVGHAHEADQGQQQQQRPDRRETEGVGETFNQPSPKRELRDSRSRSVTCIASRAAMTAR